MPTFKGHKFDWLLYECSCFAVSLQCLLPIFFPHKRYSTQLMHFGKLNVFVPWSMKDNLLIMM